MLFDAGNLNTEEGVRRLLSFAAHEYFHAFNVKRIRPIALGPFDYDREVFTNMLYVSEGFTSYYSDLIMQRAGFTSPDQYLNGMSRSIAGLENKPGHLFQSVAESSIDTWIKASYLARDENLSNTTISYYNKGSIIGALLDLKIRNETRNQKSLDDVMRMLYKDYFLEKNRGFTDEEFREVCERIAGAPLAEIFDDYVYDTKEIDYPKYFAYAGLKIDTELRAQPGAATLGVVMDNNNQIISWIQYDSPAQKSGLSAQDQILAIDGVPAGKSRMADILKTKKPGDKIKLLVTHNNRDKEVEVVLGQDMERSFKIQRVDNPTALQSAILNSWLKNK
jgi:predicted metalloprotease with PDZ domain